MAESGTLLLTQENLDDLHDAMVRLRDTLPVIEEDIINKNSEKVVEDNFIDKTKASLTTEEKARFLNISKIFVNEWMASIKKFQAEIDKKSKLKGTAEIGAKKKSSPFQFLSKLLSKKKDKPKIAKKGKSWLTILLTIGAVLMGFWVLLKAKIIKIPDQVMNALKELAVSLWDLSVELLKLAGEVIWSGMKMMWNYICEKLNLDVIVDFFSNIWGTISPWLSSAWNTISSAFTGLGKWFSEIPNKIWNWITDAVTGIFDSIVNAITGAWDWLCEKASSIWNWLKENFTWDKIWGGITNLFNGVVDWCKKIFTWDNIWNAIKGIFTAIPKFLWSLLSDDMQLKFKEWFIKIRSWLPRWAGGISEAEANKQLAALEKIRQANAKNKNAQPAKVSKEETPAPKVENSAAKVIEKQQEIKLKDNLLETVKAICDRFNVFFSDKQDSFIDLSNKLILEAQKGFQNIYNQLSNLKLQNIYNVKKEDEYHDSYDQSDHSTRTITYDYSNNGDYDFSIHYNNIDIPALDRAIDTIEQQNKKEIELLESQNDYLCKMITNIDDFSGKLTRFDQSKKELKPQNNIAVIDNAPQSPGAIPAQTRDMMRLQQLFGTNLGNFFTKMGLGA